MTRPATRRALLPGLLLAAACAGSGPTSSTPLGSAFQLAVGAAVRLEDSDLVIEFLGVASDSRCPVDVQCLVAGDAVVVLSVAGGGAPSARYELHALAEPREAQHGQYRLALLDLLPRPLSTRPVGANDYVATLKVSRSPAPAAASQGLARPSDAAGRAPAWERRGRAAGDAGS